MSHGVPVWASCRRNVGNHGRKSAHPTSTATRTAPRRFSAPDRGDAESHQYRPDQEERPVLREQERRGHERDREESHDRRGVPGIDAHDDAEQHQHHRERIHPGFGRIVDRVRRDRHDHHGRATDPALLGAAPAESGAGDVGQADRDHAEDARQCPHRNRTRAEDTDPAVQEDVVQRRRAIPQERAPQLVERQLRDVDGQRFVEPQIGLGDESQPGRCCEDDADRKPEERPHAPPRVRGRPTRGRRVGGRRLRVSGVDRSRFKVVHAGCAAYRAVRLRPGRSCTGRASAMHVRHDLGREPFQALVARKISEPQHELRAPGIHERLHLLGHLLGGPHQVVAEVLVRVPPPPQ